MYAPYWRSVCNTTDVNLIFEQLFRRIIKDQKIATEIVVSQNNILVRHGCNPKGRIHITWLLDVTSEQAKRCLYTFQKIFVKES